jgi:hypothetical protein
LEFFWLDGDASHSFFASVQVRTYISTSFLSGKAFGFRGAQTKHQSTPKIQTFLPPDS